MNTTARSLDQRHQRRIKKVTPKARFKSLTPQDQYTVTARALSALGDEARKKMPYNKSKLFHSYHITIGSIASGHTSIDPSSGLLTNGSIKKIKRAVATAAKLAIGKDAIFMFSIEQQDKNGNPCEPHIHMLANLYTVPDISKLRSKFYRIAGKIERNTVKFQRTTSLKKSNETSKGEAAARRVALYGVKNADSRTYRTSALMKHVHGVFEDIKLIS